MATGLRSMTGLATLALGAASDRARLPRAWRRRARRHTALATVAALAALEFAGDKWSGAPDRRVAPSLALRLLLGAVGGAALGHRQNLTEAAGFGVWGAAVGSFAGRTVRGWTIRTGHGAAGGALEDATALALAGTILASRPRRPA